VGPRAVLNAVENRKIPSPRRESTLEQELLPPEQEGLLLHCQYVFQRIIVGRRKTIGIQQESPERYSHCYIDFRCPTTYEVY